MSILLGGMTFEAYASTGWVFSDLTDWLTVTDAKGGLSGRPIAHGSFDPGEWLRESASPSFRVAYVGADSVDALRALQRLRAIGVSKSLIPMTVDLGDGAMTRNVRVQSIDVPDTHGRSSVSATVYTQAADPLLYGVEVSGVTGVPTAGVGIADPIIDPFQEGAPGNPGRVELTNVGTAPTTVRITVAGGLSGGVQILVVETGEVLRMERLIPDGSTVTFDSRTGRAKLDGQSDVTGFMTVDQWPQIPAGSTRTFQFMPQGTQSGTPTMRVAANPAYL